MSSISMDDVVHLLHNRQALPALVRLKNKIARATEMTLRHGWNTRRGSKWDNYARKADKKYRALWRRTPHPDTFHTCGVEGGFEIVGTYFPRSGYLRRMRIKYTKVARDDANSLLGVNIEALLLKSLNEEVV